MSMRISSAPALLVLLAACSVAESPSPSGDTVECAIGAGVDLSPDCTLEQVAGTQEIVIHHPDGGFRRFTRDPATGTLVPFDGAELLAVQPGAGGALQFAVGGDRYSIPPDLLTPASQ